MAIQDNVDRAKAFVSGPFAEICSLAEFAEICDVDESTIRHAIKSGRFRMGIDCMKFGKQWVMSKQAFVTFKGDYSEFSITCTECRKVIAASEEVTLP